MRKNTIIQIFNGLLLSAIVILIGNLSYKSGYRDGQIDCLNGKQKFEKVPYSDTLILLKPK